MSHWEGYALPTLQALAESDDRHMSEGVLMLGIGDRGASRLGLGCNDGELLDTLFQLRDLGYVEFSDPTYEAAPGAIFSNLRVTGRGMQILGEWPRFEALVSPTTLAEVVEHLTQFAPTEEERTRLQQTAAYLKRLGPKALRALVTGASAQLIRNAAGLP